MKYWDKVKVVWWFYDWLEWIVIREINDWNGRYQVRLLWNEEYIYEHLLEYDLELIK